MPPDPAAAFLDPVGTGTAQASARPSRRRAPGAALAAMPLLATLAALLVVAASGLSRRSVLPEVVEPYAYGYFLDRYPLFAFALIYGVARVAAAASGPGPAAALRRVVFGLVGIAALAAAGLYPTFGGLIVRGGFSTGGMAFLTNQPLWFAYALGAGVAAAVFGAVVGGFAIAAAGPLRPRLSRFGTGALGFLALWLGAVLIGLARDLGFGPWPHRAMRPPEAGLAALLLLAAALPHAASVWLRLRRVGA